MPQKGSVPPVTKVARKTNLYSWIIIVVVALFIVLKVVWLVSLATYREVPGVDGLTATQRTQILLNTSAPVGSDRSLSDAEVKALIKNTTVPAQQPNNKNI